MLGYIQSATKHMMLEIQCPSCNTRYRIDESIVPKDRPVFKCSRCGHVFSGAFETSRTSSGALSAKSTKSDAPSAVEGKATVADAVSAESQESRDKSPPASDISPPPMASAVQTDQSTVPASEVPPHRLSTQDTLGQDVDDEDEWVVGDQFEADEAGSELNPTEFANFKPNFQSKSRLGFYSQWPIKQIDELSGDSPVGAGPKSSLGAAGYSQPGFGGLRGTPEKGQRGLELTKPGYRGGLRQEERGNLGIRVAGSGFAQAASERVTGLGRPSSFHTRVPTSTSPPHSSGFFLAVFFAFVVLFGGLSILISSDPALGRQLLTWLPFFDSETEGTSSARRVELREVSAKFERLKDNTRALVITGQVLNRSPTPLHTVEIVATLLGEEHQRILKQTAYCGNTIQSDTVAQMTSREIAFFQRLPAPSSFLLPPGQSVPFVVAFIEPPLALARAFQVEVGKVEPAREANEASEAETR